MELWLIAVICLAIAVGAVLLVSAIKWLAKKNAERKGKTIDMKKAEFPLALSAFIIAFCGVAAFLYFYANWKIGIALGSAGLYGFATEGIYILVIQLARKGFVGAMKSIFEIFRKLKASKNPVAELPQIIEDMVEENADKTTSETTNSEAIAEQRGNEIYNEIFKDEK